MQTALSGAAVKIVAFSGAFRPEFLKISRTLGATAALQKPIGLEKLLETLQAVLRPAA